MTSNHIERKDGVLKILVGMIGIILMCILIVGQIQFYAWEYYSPFLAKNLAKDERNIKNNGCLIYAGKFNNHTDMYSLNGQTSNRLEALTVKEFPFLKKWQSYDTKFYLDFPKKYSSKSKECFKVKYISTKTLWFNVDFIYDVDETQ